MPRVLYNSHATAAVYAIIRAELPPGFELVTLEADDEAERIEKIRDCEVAIVASAPLRRPVIDAGTRLRLVHHQGVGYHDTIDWAALAERGIPLALTPEGKRVQERLHPQHLANENRLLGALDKSERELLAGLLSKLLLSLENG